MKDQQDIKEILKDPEKVNQFLQENRKLVVTAIKSAFPSILHTYDEEDYIQEGMIWLYKSMLKYDESRNVKFSTFAFIVIKSKIMQKIKYSQNKIKQYDNNVISIYHTINSNSDDFALIDKIPDKRSYINIIDVEYHKKVINTLRKKLQGRSREIFEYILQKKTPNEMAKIVGCTNKNIYEIIKKIKIEADNVHKYVFKTA
jgi:RNA polymerase sporulation-specific sigma factor